MKQFIKSTEFSYSNWTSQTGDITIETTVVSYINDPKKHFTNFPYGVTDEEIIMYCLQTGTSVLDLKCLINQLTLVKKYI
ncbi:MAG: hypothetical protein EOM41_00715 [Bacilli bacterium]|nr:hypothetical protein [Bacilli bacterium]